MDRHAWNASGKGATRLMDWRIGRSGVLEFAGLSVMGLFMAATAAFDAYPGATVADFVYWQGAMLGGGVIAALIEPPLHRRLEGRPRLFALVQTLAMTPPITLWIWTWANLVHVSAWDLRLLAPLAASVLVVNAAVVALAWLLRSAFWPRDPAPAATDVAPSAIRAKLPPRLARARLLAVQAEDHYLRIHTEAGSDLVLMRLADALTALQDSDGFQVHRSWWVARQAVETVRWKKGRGAMSLRHGLQVPVSETFAPAIRAVDWG